jgi:general transcription factor 3C polypeptide 5 (transcription factor C subunit 1)
MNPIVLDKLPEQIFHVVEYPGFVKNSGKAIETLGGELAVEDAFGKEDLGCLQLNYRPEDEFSHAINGDVINTSNLVVGPCL